MSDGTSDSMACRVAAYRRVQNASMVTNVTDGKESGHSSFPSGGRRTDNDGEIRSKCNSTALPQVITVIDDTSSNAQLYC